MSAIPGGAIGFSVHADLRPLDKATVDAQKRVTQMAKEMSRVKPVVVPRIDTQRMQADAAAAKRFIRDLEKEFARIDRAAVASRASGGAVVAGARARASAATGGGGVAGAVGAAAAMRGAGLSGDAGVGALLKGTGAYLAVSELARAMKGSASMAEQYNMRLKAGVPAAAAFTASLLEGIPVVKNLKDGMQSALDAISGDWRIKARDERETKQGIGMDQALNAARDRQVEAERQRRIVQAGQYDPLLDPTNDKQMQEFRRRRVEAEEEHKREEDRIHRQVMQLPRFPTGDEAKKFAEAQRAERALATANRDEAIRKANEEEAAHKKKLADDAAERARQMADAALDYRGTGDDAVERWRAIQEETRSIAFSGRQLELRATGRGGQAELMEIKERARLALEEQGIDEKRRAAILQRQRGELMVLGSDLEGRKQVTGAAMPSGSALLTDFTRGAKRDEAADVLKRDIKSLLQSIDRSLQGGVPAVTS